MRITPFAQNMDRLHTLSVAGSVTFSWILLPEHTETLYCIIAFRLIILPIFYYF